MLNLSAQEAAADDKILKIARAIDEFEGYPFPHASRVAEIADILAQRFYLAAHDLSSLRQAALLHDLGEMTMNRDYIRADRALRPDERVDMQRHPVIGEQETAKLAVNRAVQLLVRWHHEWWNGGGYPDALTREQIPLAARILRVADTYATLTEARPYRQPFSTADARKHLTEWAGIEFDPAIVKMLVSLVGSPELDSYHESARF